jgi:sugar O-acyltransferase (sialic acid O-acetyltransferase NeuD family)
MLIIGAGGFAKQLVMPFIQRWPNIEPIFFDDYKSNQHAKFLNRFQIIRNLSEVEMVFNTDELLFILGVGESDLREKMCIAFENIGGQLSDLIDVSASISPFEVSIAPGLTCLSNVIIEPNVLIGKGVLINVSTFIAHDVKIGDFSVVGPGVKLLGGSSVGRNCMIGAGAILLPKVTLGDNVQVGAGAVVTKDLPNGVLAYGNPARIASTR